MFEGSAEIVLKTKPWRTVMDVKRSVARHFKLTVAELESRDKHWRVSHPRLLAMALAYRNLNPLGYSTTMVGREFNRHYSTVLYALRKHGIPPDPFVAERSALAHQRRVARSILEHAA